AGRCHHQPGASLQSEFRSSSVRKYPWNHGRGSAAHRVRCSIHFDNDVFDVQAVTLLYVRSGSGTSVRHQDNQSSTGILAAPHANHPCLHEHCRCHHDRCHTHHSRSHSPPHDRLLQPHADLCIDHRWHNRCRGHVSE